MFLSIACITIIAKIPPIIVIDVVISFPSIFKILLYIVFVSIFPLTAEFRSSPIFTFSKLSLVYFSPSFINDDKFNASSCEFINASVACTNCGVFKKNRNIKIVISINLILSLFFAHLTYHISPLTSLTALFL